MQQALTLEESSAYKIDRQNRMRARFVLCGVLAWLGYASYAILDWLAVSGAQLRLILQVRGGFLLVLLLLTWLSQRPFVARFLYVFSQFMCVYICMGAVVITALIGPAAYAYHLGMLLVLVGWTALMPWRGRDAIVAYTIVLGGYIALELAFNGPSLAALITGMSYAIAIVVSIVSVVVIDNLSQERFLLLRRVESAYADLQKIDEAKNTFFANVSHEMRTPLMLVLASVENIRDEVDRNGQHAPQFATVNRHGLRLLATIDELLELTRLDASADLSALKPTRWPVFDFLQGQVDQVAPLANKKQITLKMVAHGVPFSIHADRTAIERVVRNLLTNALKFTPVGGAIEILVEMRGQQAVVRVIDTGAGISAEDLPNVFKRYYQGQGGKKVMRGGIGIGLSMCEKVVTLHGGTIGISSVLGQGTQVTFTLPSATTLSADGALVVADPVITAPILSPQGLPEWDKRLREQDDYQLSGLRAATERRAAPLETRNEQSLTVLIVDDDPEMLELIHGMLVSTYNVATASDGVEGLDRARRRKPDLIISDVNMPNLNGFDMLAKIREDISIKDTPVVMMTARGLRDDRQAASELQADDFLPKPFTGTQLRPILARLLSRQHSHINQVSQAAQNAVNLAVSGLAHDIMNPVSFVRTASMVMGRVFLSVVERAEAAGVELIEEKRSHEEVRQVVRSGLERVTDAIEQLKKFAKGQELDKPVVVPFTPLVQRTVVVAQSTANIHEVLDSKAKVAVKPGQIERVILNLVLNAIQAGGEGCSITVKTFDDAARGVAIVQVIDDGPGMDENTLKKIFDARFTTKATGSGLGLTMCREIAQAHGGSLDADSAVGRGASFTLALPVVG